jgi:hypothetical protein
MECLRTLIGIFFYYGIVAPVNLGTYVWRYFTSPYFKYGRYGDTIFKSLQIMNICEVTESDEVQYDHRQMYQLRFLKDGKVVAHASQCRCCYSLGVNIK